MLSGMTSPGKIHGHEAREQADNDPFATQSFLTERELAKRWNISTRTLQRWRANGVGPRAVRIGDSIRYRPCDVLSFENGEDRS